MRLSCEGAGQRLRQSLCDPKDQSTSDPLHPLVAGVGKELFRGRPRRSVKIPCR